MAGLVLKLNRHERILVNGAMIENGDRKTEVRVLTKDSIILRERLLLTPESAKGRLGQTALLAQNAALGLIDRDRALLRLRNELKQLIDAATSPDLALRLCSVLNHVEAEQLREAFLKMLRIVRGFEPEAADILND